MPVVKSDSSLRIQHLARIVESDFREMPGMQLTRVQAQRLWNLTAEDCRCVFEYLMDAGRLEQDVSGQYCMPRASY